MSETTLSVAQARIQLYPLVDLFDTDPERVVKIKSRSGDGAVLVSAAHYAQLAGK